MVTLNLQEMLLAAAHKKISFGCPVDNVLGGFFVIASRPFTKTMEAGLDVWTSER